MGISSLLPSCYKDEGNYDLVDYNKILSIKSPPMSALTILGDTFRLKPIIQWKYPERDTLAFEYEWRQIDSVISNQRDLAYTPDIPGYVNIYLYMKEKATGIVARFSMQLQVVSAYKAGWLLLTENGGQSGLSYVRRDTKRDANNVVYYEYKSYPDIYSKLFPETPLGNNPVRILTKNFPDYTIDQVLVVQGNETVFLSGDDFSKKIALVSEFPGRAFPNNAKPVDYADGTSSNFTLLDDGKVYWKRNEKLMGGIHDGLFMDVPVYFEGGGATISRFIDIGIDYSQFVYLYDNLKKRFIGLYTTTGSNDFIGGKMFLQEGSTPPPGWVSLNNQTGYTLQYCSDYANGAGFMNIIKNNNTGQYLYQTYKLQMQYTFIEVSNQTQEVFAGNGIVSDNTVYHRIRNSSYLFFGEGSKLYFYDINTKRITLYTDFGAGNIVQITTDANSGELGVALNNGNFYICSLKNDVLGHVNPGSVGILYHVANLGNIVDLQWKWGSYYEYVFRRYPG